MSCLQGVSGQECKNYIVVTLALSALTLLVLSILAMVGEISLSEEVTLGFCCGGFGGLLLASCINDPMGTSIRIFLAPLHMLI